MTEFDRRIADAELAVAEHTGLDSSLITADEETDASGKDFIIWSTNDGKRFGHYEDGIVTETTGMFNGEPE